MYICSLELNVCVGHLSFCCSKYLLQNMRSKKLEQISTSLRFIQYQLNTLRLTGHYPLPADVCILLRAFHSVYTAVFKSVTGSLVLCQIMYLCSGDNVLETLSNGASETIAFALVYLKGLIFMCHVNRNRNALKKLENSWTTNLSRQDSNRILRIIKETESLVRTTSYISYFSTLITLVSFALAPMLMTYLNENEIGSKMPMNIWHPFELTNPSGRLLLYVIQISSIGYLGCVITSLVNLYITILCMLEGEFRILQSDFIDSACGYTNDHSGGVTQEVIIFNVLKNQVEKHQFLLR